MKNLKILEKKGYLIKKGVGDNYTLCRIIKEYDNKADAIEGLVALLTSNISEKELMGVKKKSIFERLRRYFL